MKQQAGGPVEGGKWPPSLYSRTYRILEDLYENSSVLYCTVSANGIILDCNGTYARRMGYSRVESIGTPIFDHIGPNSMVAMHEYLEIWQKIGILENFEVWLRRKDGDVFPALMNAASVHDEHGNVVACNIVLINQTDIYKTKKDVERANEELKVKEQLKNEFIAIASHELRTPIQPLLGYAILAKKGKVTQEAAWEGILKEARRLQQLANDILDVSRIESDSITYQMEKVAIASVLESTVDSARTNLGKDVSMELAIDDTSSDLELDLDRSRMTQVLSNIIGNAVKFTKSGNIKVECQAFSSKNKIEIRVSDTGAGIPEQILPNLFGKFVTKSAGETNGHSGTGLGLFISKAIVTAHKGEIYAYNNAAGGATFTIVLPIEQSNIIYE
ncbi:MAG TPA: PAS domain-containing sensor histidine kinase [Nitrososphaera sp.]|nr:PAS domain-containing sensor histidine kinase [Nitrososphaera sp.]